MRARWYNLTPGQRDLIVSMLHAPFYIRNTQPIRIKT